MTNEVTARVIQHLVTASEDEALSADTLRLMMADLAIALDAQPEVLAEGWAWPLEPDIDEYGNRYFCVYLDGPQSEADYPVAITKR